jgi:hypothetical protein
MTTLVLASSDHMANVHKALAHDQTIDAIMAALVDTAMSAVAIKTGEEITTNALILSATSAHTHAIVAHTKDNSTSARDPTRAILAGRAAPGRARPLPKNNKSIHRAPPTTTNSSKATMNTFRAMRTIQAHAAQPLIVVTTTIAQKASPSRIGLAMTAPKSSLLQSVTSPAYQMVASSKVHARFNGRKLASGQRSLTIPKRSSATSYQKKKL